MQGVKIVRMLTNLQCWEIPERTPKKTICGNWKHQKYFFRKPFLRKKISVPDNELQLRRDYACTKKKSTKKFIPLTENCSHANLYLEDLEKFYQKNLGST